MDSICLLELVQNVYRGFQRKQSSCVTIVFSIQICAMLLNTKPVLDILFVFWLLFLGTFVLIHVAHRYASNRFLILGASEAAEKGDLAGTLYALLPVAVRKIHLPLYPTRPSHLSEIF